MTEPQPIPAKPRFSVAFYVLLGLVALICIGVAVYREGAPGRKSAAEVQAFLSDTETARVTFFKLDPKDEDPSQPRTGRRLHGWRVLGEQPLKEAETQDLRSILTSGSTYGTGSFHCFQPGMGIRFQTEARVIDLVVCLSCQKFLAYEGDEARSWSLSGIGCRRLGTLYTAHAA